MSVVGDKVQRARVAHCARLGSLEWEDLKRKVPENLLEGSPGLENSAAAAVWDVLEEIGTGSPGWNRCGAATDVRLGASLFSRLEWLEEVMVIEIEKWMMISVCSAKASELRQNVFASIKRLEVISCVVLMIFTLQCMNTT